MVREKNVQRIEVECIFRATRARREFVTPGNYEAFNMLMNKLDKRGIKDQEGKLVFEFVLMEKK